jgi:hypothetical protein
VDTYAVLVYVGEGRGSHEELGGLRYLVGFLLCLATRHPGNQRLVGTNPSFTDLYTGIMPLLTAIDVQLEAMELLYDVAPPHAMAIDS